MKFAVKALCNGKARTGLLQMGNCPSPIETPALLLTTRKGLPVFVAPDLLPSLPSPDSHLLQISPLHFLECPSTRTISNIGGLHQMLGLQEFVFSAVPRDSILCLPQCEGTNRFGASFETTTGRRLIQPVEYMELIASLKPNIMASLADEVPAWVSEKRNRTSVDRTVQWLDDCVALNLVNKVAGVVFGAIVGGSSVEERSRCAHEVAKRNVSGLRRAVPGVFSTYIEHALLPGSSFKSARYWLGGFGLGEGMDERSALLNAVTDILPEEQPRQICGLGLPEEVLQGVAAGIDLFDSAYIYHLTLGGFALTFSLDITEGHVYDSSLSDTGSDNTKINLRATIYRKDTSQIVDGCTCYTCQNHTKAYINHLLNVHEMLAQILLDIHNTHHYLGFFRSIREAINEGRFDLFYQKFIENRREHLSNAVVCS